MAPTWQWVAHGAPVDQATLCSLVNCCRSRPEIAQKSQCVQQPTGFWQIGFLRPGWICTSFVCSIFTACWMWATVEHTFGELSQDSKCKIFDIKASSTTGWYKAISMGLGSRMIRSNTRRSAEPPTCGVGLKAPTGAYQDQFSHEPRETTSIMVSSLNNLIMTILWI